MAATTLQMPKFDQPRTSAETDRRHLLESESIAPSERSSIIDFPSGETTPRAQTPTNNTSTNNPNTTSTDSGNFRIPAGTHTRHQSLAEGPPSYGETVPRPYRGFPSEAHYLVALQAWVESKKYIEPQETSLVGFYGQTTMQEYANRPGVEGLNLRKKWRARKASKAEERERKMNERRNTVA